MNSNPTAKCPRILIGFGEALSAPEVAWNLLDSGFEVSVFTRKGRRPPLSFSRDVEIFHITPPECDVYDSLRCLEQYIAEHKYAAVMPLDDAAVWVCDNLSEKMNLPIAGPRGVNRELALDKRLQLKLAAECGFSVPHTVFIDSVEQLLQCDEFPVVLKPALAIMFSNGRLMHNSIKICTNRRDIENVAYKWNTEMPFIAQPFLRGTGIGMFGIATSTGIKNWSSHRRIRMMNPTGSGSSACRSIAVNETLTGPAARMMESVGWRGLFMIELLCDDAGRTWFMEINGRSWGSMALSRRRGFNYPAWAIRQILDPYFIPPIVCHNSDIVCRHLGREIVHLLIVLHGPKSRSAVQWPSRMKTIRDILHVRRSDYWYNWRPGEFTLFIYDTLQTIANKVFPRNKCE